MLSLLMVMAGMTTDILSFSNIFETVMALIIAALLLTANIIVFAVIVAGGWYFVTFIKKLFKLGDVK